MDFYIHNIKMFACLVFAPDRHTVHKTMRVPCRKRKHGQALCWLYKPKPPQSYTLGGLLNDYLMAVDFTNYRETDRLFLFFSYLSNYAFLANVMIYISVWQCYIAKYP